MDEIRAAADLTLLEEAFASYEDQPGALIPILQRAQALYGYLPPDVLQGIADRLDLTLGKVYGVATFYAQFYLERRGRHVLKLCDGTACHVKGATALMSAVEEEYGVKADSTTADGQLSLEIVYCMGSCALAPVAVVERPGYRPGAAGWPAPASQAASGCGLRGRGVHMAVIADVAVRRATARELWLAKTGSDLYITVGMGTCGLAAGAQDTLAAIQAELQQRHLQATIGQVGCVGMCSYEPMVELQAAGRPRINYGQASAENVPEIFAAYLDGAPLGNGVVVGEVMPDVAVHAGQALHSLEFVDPQDHSRIPFQQNQLRVVLSNCGLIDPESIDDYLAQDGYLALEKVLSGMAPEAVAEEVIKSGLRGRGGGGFSTGVKWKLARQTQRWPKYVICNADEGDPGAFMDRSALEGDPHSLIEGMIIAGYAIGAQKGFIYCRAEYPLAIRRLKIALGQAHDLGLLGERILGSEFSFDIVIKEGAGAFVCGEETALMNSIQGERGQPWPRPPYPAVAGLWGQPSNVNNVKSYAYVPRIIRLGADWFRSLGTEGSPGTAIFALSGMVKRTGLIEVPMGVTLGQIIYEIGGGIPGGRKFKAVQTGGPLGGCLPESYLDTPVDFDSAAGGRRRHGVRRHDRCRRDHLHGGVRQILHEVRLRGELRQVPALPAGQHAHAGDPGAHHGRGGAAGGCRADPPSGRRHATWLAVRPGPTGAVADPIGAAPFRR